MRVVVVEAERLAGRVLEVVLGEAGHEVVLATSAQAGLEAIVGRETGAVLAAAVLPGADGPWLCKELRGRRYTGPLLIIGGHGAQTAVRVFDAGADDYLASPYDPAELLARLGAVARRFRNADRQGLGTVIKAGDAELSLGELTFRVAGRRPSVLTPTEMRMLECLMRNQGIAIGRETLIERTWGYDFYGDTNRVDVYVRRLRKKVERNPEQPEYLHTVRGLGYTFRPPSEGRLVPFPASITSMDGFMQGVAD